MQRPQIETGGSALAHCLYLGVAGLVITGFAMVAYKAFQPEIHPNPGLAAYQLPAALALYPQSEARPSYGGLERLDAGVEERSEPSQAPTTIGESAKRAERDVTRHTRTHPRNAKRAVSRSPEERGRSTVGYAPAPAYGAFFRPW